MQTERFLCEARITYNIGFRTNSCIFTILCQVGIRLPKVIVRVFHRKLFYPILMAACRIQAVSKDIAVNSPTFLKYSIVIMLRLNNGFPAAGGSITPSLRSYLPPIKPNFLIVGGKIYGCSTGRWCTFYSKSCVLARSLSHKYYLIARFNLSRNGSIRR